MNKRIIAIVLGAAFAAALGAAAASGTALASPDYGDDDYTNHYNDDDKRHSYYYHDGYGGNRTGIDGIPEIDILDGMGWPGKFLKDCYYIYAHNGTGDWMGQKHMKGGFMGHDYMKGGYMEMWPEGCGMMYGMALRDGIQTDLFAWDVEPGTMTVTGTATASAEPERVVMRLGVDTTAMTAKDALSTNSALLTAAVDAITSLDIPSDDIATSQITIYPKYDSKWDDHGNYMEVFAGYVVSNTVVVDTTQMDKTADIIDAAVVAGINRVESIDFALLPESDAMIRDSLIEAAALDAKRKANLVLEPLQHKIVGIEDIRIHSGEYEEPLIQEFGLLREAIDMAYTPVFAPDQNLSSSVTITFLIGPAHFHK